jgi:UDP-sugar transporter A1/2/3
MELMKFIICLGVVGTQAGSMDGLAKQLRQHILHSPGELLKLSVPSFLYMIQNNLLYLALSNLDAATYQVCYQLKILTTAVFSALMLKRKFSRTKWTAIVILTIGVAIVQSSGSGDDGSGSGGKDGDDGEALASSSHQRLVGLIAVLCAACTSGFSGVYFERILKGSSTTLWIRNIQMGLPSVLLAFLGVYTKDHKAVHERGFFGGYTTIVWMVVIVQAAGGLIVAVVVRYADNVLKTFAASFSIVVSCVVSAILFDFRPNTQFVVGTVLVVSATAMYSRPDGSSFIKRRRRRRRQILPTTATIADARRSRHRSFVA